MPAPKIVDKHKRIDNECEIDFMNREKLQKKTASRTKNQDLPSNNNSTMKSCLKASKMIEIS